MEKDAYGEYLFKYERVILDPRTADGDAAPMSSPLIVDGAFGTPSRRNNGEFFSLAYDSEAKQLRWKSINGDVAAVAVIASRKSGSTQFRSTAKFVLNEAVLGSDKCSLLEAIGAAQAGSTEVYIEEDSALYLNNEANATSNDNDSEGSNGSSSSNSSNGSSGSSENQGGTDPDNGDNTNPGGGGFDSGE